jgi:hypothetical protein
MEKRDYLMREIEKIGMVLQAILNRLTGKGGNSAITLESSFEATRELLLNETDFDLTLFLAMDQPASRDYLARFQGMNTTNLEQLAEILFQLGINEQADKKSVFLSKSIQLFELSENIDKTYSIERESRIREIKSAL